MSDYIFSSSNQPKGFLGQLLQNIYREEPPPFFEFHGDWGSLAITQQHYNGFLPFESEQHLMVVIGGPVLYFCDNGFLAEDDSNVATKAIYKRFLIDGNMQWDEDLSGPFTIFLIDKQKGSVATITDLMAFIPVYTCQKKNTIYLGTHVDVLAKAANEAANIDQVSLADFMLHGIVTYPYTVYQNVRQTPPASLVSYSGSIEETIDIYWVPTEENNYKSLKEAASALQVGVQYYIDRVTEKMTSVAQFISAGEDSRALSGLLSKHIDRDAYIFLDSMNREGKIAKKVSLIYGVNLKVGYRNKTHYLDILKEASTLVGLGHQYTHAHSLGFNRKYNLSKYSGVFGGYFSDSLLKAAYSRKAKGIGRFPFMPQFGLPGESRSKVIKSTLINEVFLAEVTRRRCRQLESLQHDRPLTAHEWFVLRPASMRATIPNLFSSRRLFKCYEPFMCNQAVKVSAAVPTSWKLNRRLFNTAMKVYLKKSKWLFHADGRLPYFSWWINAPIQLTVLLCRYIAQRAGFIKGNQGPWGDWEETFKDAAWRSKAEGYASLSNKIEFLSESKNIESILLSKDVNKKQKINLVQILQVFEEPIVYSDSLSADRNVN